MSSASRYPVQLIRPLRTIPSLTKLICCGLGLSFDTIDLVRSMSQLRHLDFCCQSEDLVYMFEGDAPFPPLRALPAQLNEETANLIGGDLEDAVLKLAPSLTSLSQLFALPDMEPLVNRCHQVEHLFISCEQEVAVE
jgi:hypothetical protein